MLAFILLYLLTLHEVTAGVLVRRDSNTTTCVGLTVKSNNGNRKVAIVIDSSGSMAESDPDNLRLAAGKSLNDWLITKNEAVGGKKEDLVTVINFDDEATLDYPLGDPSGADSAFDNIGADGGTFIAGGVEMAIAQLTTSSSGTTSGRSAIVVFTDGEDSDTQSLVDQINKAADLGIRVSFGFLDESASYQDPDVLYAIGMSHGVYSTIVSAASSNSFINSILVNGLTNNDNPSGSNSVIIAGLSTSHFISGSQTVTLTYPARDGEIVTFTIQSINAGSLTAYAQLGGKTVATDEVTQGAYGYGSLDVDAQTASNIKVIVAASSAPQNGMFIVSATSNLPVQNCTVAVGGGSGLSTGAKAGLGVGIPIALGLVGLGSYFLWKFFKKTTPMNRGIESNAPPKNSQKHRRMKRFKKRKHDQFRHHHHAEHGALQHPCSHDHCELNDEKMPAQNPIYPCTCLDEKCQWNDPKHKCNGKSKEDSSLPCPCSCIDPQCPLNEPEFRKEREDEWNSQERKKDIFHFGKQLFRATASSAVHSAISG